MLTQLYIDHVAVIEHAEISLAAGLTVLTGETGAGKSILIDALSAVLGERVSRDLVRSGCSQAVVTAVFDQLTAPVIEQLNTLGYSAEEDGTLLLRRRISAENKSVCYIGAQPCTASVMRSVGRLLVNIHGQHENQSLLSVDRHLTYLDRLGGLEELRARYEEIYHAYCATHRRLKKLNTDENAKAMRLDMLRFQTDEIDSAALTAGEEDALLARRDVLRNAEKISRSLLLADRQLNGSEEEDGALSLSEQAVASLREAARYLPQARELALQMENALTEFRDGARALSDLANDPNFDPAELEEVEDRLALIRRLCEKYGKTTEEVLAFAESARNEWMQIEHSDEERRQLEQQLEAEKARLLEAAKQLTDARKKAAHVFCSEVGKCLTFLDMPHVSLEVSVEPTALTATGADKVEFLISANPGEPPKSLAKIASGGELSRVMLALKSVMASADEIPTLIFDEIDAGISGRAATKVGCQLRSLAQSGGKQVLCVTHLAQIAACAHHHLLIEKQVKEERTFTMVQSLDQEGRVKELARIIGGPSTPSALGTAREMLAQFADLANG